MPEHKRRSTVFFRNLDGLRGVAFGVVFVYHAFGYLGYSAGSSAGAMVINHILFKGHLGVNLFFVLSGFLITYLLLAEKEKTGRINVLHFYLRRVLRIWPLYFATLLVAFFLFPAVSGNFSGRAVNEHLPWYIAFLNNFDRIRTGFSGIGNDNAGVLWSIAVEEQFYLFWPLLIALTQRRLQPALFIILIAASLVYRFLHVNDATRLYLHTLSVTPDLVIGAALAWLATYRPGFRRRVEHCPRYVFAFLYALLAVAVFFSETRFSTGTAAIVFERIVFALLFAGIVAEQCFAHTPLFRMGRHAWLNFVGLISFGLYCLHLYTISVAQHLNAVLGFGQPPKWLFFTELLGCFGLSVGLCYLSYRYFETPFLKLKARFAAVTTRTA